MTIYIDDEQLPWRGKLWCHMVADSLDELHVFAERLGLRRSWFQVESRFPHYDVTMSVRAKAVSMGAQIGDRRTVLTCARQLKAQLPENVSGAVM